IIMGCEFMHDIPFEKVLIHGIVRDRYGKKMSKSLGNVVDPLAITAHYGTDALRYTLIASAVPGRDLQLAEDSFIGARNFTNKLWNASRFILMNLTDYDSSCTIKADDFELTDQWILHRYAVSMDEMYRHLNEYNLAQICRVIHGFFWKDFCDWYIELAKPRLQGTDAARKQTVQHVLAYIMEGLLKTLHPVMPFVTEELWHLLHETIDKKSTKQSNASIMQTELPADYQPYLAYRDVEPVMNTLQEMITGIRNIRSEMRIAPGSKINIHIKIRSDATAKAVEYARPFFVHFARVNEMVVGRNINKPAQSATVVVGDNEVFIPLKGIIDIDKEKTRLSQELNELKEEITRNQKKLENKNFVTRAPEKEVEKVRMRIQGLRDKQTKIQSNIKGLTHE
ncbi:MAG: class I tRNA ligase family protein, partial [Elusimicrobia bacterium]|nr:class I tRNA ligase family protein [Elusimicrobiota bacterium]MBD3412161.1 class I tRNA ligase family protein [Elusimicrobiota bacterium]